MSFLLTEIATSFLRQRQEERSFEKNSKQKRNVSFLALRVCSDSKPL